MELKVTVYENQRPDMCWATQLIARITINGEHMLWPSPEGELVDEFDDLDKRRDDFNRRLNNAIARLDHLKTCDSTEDKK